MPDPIIRDAIHVKSAIKRVFFFFSAGMIIGLHYEGIMEIIGCCPIPVVCGVNRLGKSKSAKGALSLIGNMGSFYS